MCDAGKALLDHSEMLVRITNEESAKRGKQRTTTQVCMAEAPCTHACMRMQPTAHKHTQAQDRGEKRRPRFARDMKTKEAGKRRSNSATLLELNQN